MRHLYRLLSILCPIVHRLPDLGPVDGWWFRNVCQSVADD